MDYIAQEYDVFLQLKRRMDEYNSDFERAKPLQQELDFFTIPRYTKKELLHLLEMRQS